MVSDSFIFDTHTLFHKNLGKERRQERNKKQKQTKQFQILDTDIFIITATTAEGGRKERKKERKKEMNQQIVPYLTHLILPLPFVWLQLN